MKFTKNKNCGAFQYVFKVLEQRYLVSFYEDSYYEGLELFSIYKLYPDTEGLGASHCVCLNVTRSEMQLCVAVIKKCQ